MALYTASINSGSNGNCYYVGNEQDAVLVDAGITCREIEKRMRRIDLSMQKVRAIFISHEHGDHIKGVEVLSRKHAIPVYITELTHRHSGLQLDAPLQNFFAPGDAVTIGSLTVHSFAKSHDAADPQSFVISDDEVNVGVFTDIGMPCNNLKTHFSRCHAAFLEANYDEQMLQNGRYPYHLKRRISGDEGHLSNRQALELFLAHRAPFLKHLFLAHLSKDNNTPEAALDVFAPHAGHTRVSVASRYQESEVFRIASALSAPIRRHSRSVQASLF